MDHFFAVTLTFRLTASSTIPLPKVMPQSERLILNSLVRVSFSPSTTTFAGIVTGLVFPKRVRSPVIAYFSSAADAVSPNRAARARAESERVMSHPRVKKQQGSIERCRHLPTSAASLTAHSPLLLRHHLELHLAGDERLLAGTGE